MKTLSSDAVLLKVNGDSLEIRIFGKPEGATIFEDNRVPRPRLLVQGSKCTRVLRVPFGETVLSDWSMGDAGPLFREEREYVVTVHSKTDTARLELDRVEEAVRAVDERSGFVSATLRLRGQAGLVPLRVSNDFESIDIAIDVYPSKMEYAADFEEMVDRLTSLRSGLALDFARATILFGHRDLHRHGSTVEWLGSCPTWWCMRGLSS